MTALPSLSVVIFAYNEAKNVLAVLGELKRWLSEHEPRAEILFVDDGSNDHTFERAQQALHDVPHQLLRHRRNLGIGAALKTGVRAARAPWVTFLPCDGQIAPAAIGALRDAALRSGAEVVFSVYDHRDDGWDRKVLSWGVRLLIRLVHGVRLNSDGPYLFKRDLFAPEVLASDTFFLNFEFPIMVQKNAIRTDVVKIACRPRQKGFSKSTRCRKIALVARDLLDLRIRTARASFRHRSRRHRSRK